METKSTTPILKRKSANNSANDSECHDSALTMRYCVELRLENGKTLKVANNIDLSHLSIEDMYQDAPMEIEQLFDTLVKKPFLMQVRKEFQTRIESLENQQLPEPEQELDQIESNIDG